MYSWIWLLRFALRRLVERHHDVVAVPHDRRPQRRELGRDLRLVEVAQLPEPHHVLVERHPFVEPALLDVADDVIDVDQPDGRADGLGRQPVALESRAVVAVVVATIDERVLGLAIGGDRRQPQHSVLVGQLVRLVDRAGAARDRRFVGGGRVVDDERQIVGAVTVLADVVPDLAIRA